MLRDIYTYDLGTIKMSEFYLEKLHGIRVDLDPNNQEIRIWVNHDRNYTNGCYYRILNNQSITFVVLRTNEMFEIPIQNFSLLKKGEL